MRARYCSGKTPRPVGFLKGSRHSGVWSTPSAAAGFEGIVSDTGERRLLFRVVEIEEIKRHIAWQYSNKKGKIIVTVCQKPAA